MNFVSPYNVGIDNVINSVQTELYNLLIARWVDDINGYGRIYKNEDSQGKVTPKRHISEGDYEDVFFDDNFSGNFFFMDNDTHNSDDNLVYNAEVKCVFMVDLKKILLDDTGRPDEIAHRDVIEFLRTISDERYTIKRVEKGVDTIFVGIDKSSIKVVDLNPLHIFAVVLDLNYYLTDKCV